MASEDTGPVCAGCALAGALATSGGERDTEQLNLHDIPKPGEKVVYIGDYELLQVIAQGGMGVVYKARQRTLNREVALKLLLGGAYASKDFKKRFLQEAETAGKLQHPNIVPIYEVGEHEGQPFFSMEYVAGSDLAKSTREQPMAPAKAAAYVKTVAEAIEYAHRQGILHRDLKPSNILIGPDERLRITDFGLAREIKSDSSLTLTGSTLGTPSYMPPEQVSVKRGEVGPASDVYSLGAVLYCLLTGRPPFVSGTLADVLQQVVHSEPVAPRQLNPAIPRDLETICLKCLEKESRRRYGTAQALADDLGRFERGEPIAARPVGLGERVVKWYRREPVVAGLIAVVILVLLAGLGLASWQWQATRQAKNVAERLAALLASERDQANAARQEAETQRQRAEGLASSSERERDQLALTLQNLKADDLRIEQLLRELQEEQARASKAQSDAKQHALEAEARFKEVLYALEAARKDAVTNKPSAAQPVSRLGAASATSPGNAAGKVAETAWQEADSAAKRAAQAEQALAAKLAAYQKDSPEYAKAAHLFIGMREAQRIQAYRQNSPEYASMAQEAAAAMDRAQKAREQVNQMSRAFEVALMDQALTPSPLGPPGFGAPGGKAGPGGPPAGGPGGARMAPPPRQTQQQPAGPLALGPPGFGVPGPAGGPGSPIVGPAGPGMAPPWRQVPAHNEKEATRNAATLRDVKGVVKTVNGNEIWVSLGANNGFAQGDKIAIYQPVPKKNSKGVVVATSYKPVAEITLDKVLKDRSMGHYTGSAKIAEGFAAADAAVDIDLAE